MLRRHLWWVAFALGVGLEAVAQRLKAVQLGFLDVGGLLGHLGDGFLVAVVVALLFELHERYCQTQTAVARAFDQQMNQTLTPEIWPDVSKQVLEKKLLRRKAEIRFRLSRLKELDAHLAVLAFEFSYELCNVSDQPQQIAIEHELDYQFSFPELNLPRFDRLSVISQGEGNGQDDIDSRGGELGKFLTGRGLFRIKRRLPPRTQLTAGPGIRVITQRTEVVAVPGSYNLYMGEYTRLQRIDVDDPIEGLEFELKIRPEGCAETLRRVGNTWVSNHLLIPGQGIEMKFILRRPSEGAPTSNQNHALHSPVTAGI